MSTARDLLNSKHSEGILYVPPDATALEAMKLMAEHNIGALLVKTAEGKVTGILSERDLVRKLDILGRNAANTHVQDVMTGEVLYVEAGQPLEECMAIMNDKNIRHLPVYDGTKLLGVISIRDVLHAVVHEQKFMISQLEHYIRGGQ